MFEVSFSTELAKIKKKEFAPVYLVFGTETYLIDTLRKTLMENVIGPDEIDLNFSSFDMEEVSLGTVLADAESIPFFGERRLIFMNRSVFLSTEKSKQKNDPDLADFEHYLQQPSESTVLVIYAPYEKLDQRKKINKLLKKSAVLIDVQPLKERDVQKYIRDTINNEGYNISPEAFEKLIQLTDANLSTAIGELPKLFLYAQENRKITVAAVEALVPKSLEQNIFALNESVLKKDTAHALSLYQDLLLQKEDPIKINAIMAGQFRLLIQVQMLLKKGFQQSEIGKMLKVHPYRIKLAAQQIRKFDSKTLLSAYEGLIETEYHLKTGQGDRKMQFELFVLSFANKGNSKKIFS